MDNRAADLKAVTHIDNVRLGGDEKSVVIIDQTKLPNTTEYLTLRTAEDLYDAIFELKVRGAPAIGICAAYGIAVLSSQIDTEDYSIFLEEFRKYKEYLNSSRPTAVNLSWALNRMEQAVLGHQGESVAQIKDFLLQESRRIQEEDIPCICRRDTPPSSGRTPDLLRAVQRGH